MLMSHANKEFRDYKKSLSKKKQKELDRLIRASNRDAYNDIEKRYKLDKDTLEKKHARKDAFNEYLKLHRI